MRAMSLDEDMENDDNEISNLKATISKTNQIVLILSKQLDELRELVRFFSNLN
jgi:hypothetical protein